MPDQHPPPFAAALRASIAASGLSLQRISSRLAATGGPVSAATLSYWQNGTSQPGRRASLLAVRALERVLDLPDDALVALLDTERERVRAGSRALWQHPAVVDDLLDDFRVGAPQDVTTLYAHWSHRIDGHSDNLSVRKTIRAETDGTDRVLTILHTDPHPGHVEAASPCRLGRVRTDTGYTVAELILDRCLRRTETALVGYSWTAPTPSPDSYRRCCLTRAADVLVIDVEFSPDTLPADCTGFYSPRRDAPEQSLGPLWLGTTGRAHLAVSGASPGMYGIRWS